MADRNPNPSSDEPAAPPPPCLLHLSFNQDHSRFAAATDLGFRLYSSDPFRQILRRDFDTAATTGTGIAAVEMLFNSDTIALIGGGPRPFHPPNKIVIWDDGHSRSIGELNFRSPVLSVRLRRDRIVAVLERKVYVYSLMDFKVVHQFDTVPNPKGLCAVSQHPGPIVVVGLGGQKGQVRVQHYATRRTVFISAHDSRVACVALSLDGWLLATASSKGTLVRIFSTVDGILLQEVRRGSDRAEIHSLAFSASMQWLAVSSDKGTVHVFGLKINLGSSENDKPTTAPELNVPSTSSSLSFIKDHYYPIDLMVHKKTTSSSSYTLSKTWLLDKVGCGAQFNQGCSTKDLTTFLNWPDIDALKSTPRTYPLFARSVLAEKPNQLADRRVIQFLERDCFVN